MDVVNVTMVIAVALFTLIAAVWDMRTRRLPNWLTVPAFGCGLLFHLCTSGWTGLGTALAGFATGFGVLLVLWLIGGSGAGDVKYMGALGAWLGATLTVYVFLVSAALVAIGGCGVLVWSLASRGYGYVRRRYFSRPGAVSGRGGEEAAEAAQRKWRERRRLLPYALPVALGTWLVLAWKVLP
jgi:prepilin peptidase CpaA